MTRPATKKHKLLNTYYLNYFINFSYITLIVGLFRLWSKLERKFENIFKIRIDTKNNSSQDNDYTTKTSKTKLGAIEKKNVKK